jgi:phospholipid-binding lipoprotein MlaA
MMPISKSLLAALAVVMLAGCAAGPNPRDPYESFNRGVYKFNDGVDKAVLKPVVKVYDTVFPDFFRTGVSNFFANVGDVWIGVNNLLQGKPTQAASDVGRVLVNSTVGILGLFDVASDMGLQKHNEDFGQTLGRWGAEPGAYLVLPVFGPSDLRDGFGLAVDLYANPVAHIRNVPTRNTMEGVQFLNARANLSDSLNLLDTAALDPYTFVRESYIQRRRNLVYDGDPPPLPPQKDEDDKPDVQDKPAPPAADGKHAEQDVPVVLAGDDQADSGASPGRAETAAPMAAVLPAAPDPVPSVTQPATQIPAATLEPARVAETAPQLQPRSIAYPVAVPALPDKIIEPAPGPAIAAASAASAASKP